jgi:hypothetical protein
MQPYMLTDIEKQFVLGCSTRHRTSFRSSLYCRPYTNPLSQRASQASNFILD